jgi:hypothetical protein
MIAAAIANIPVGGDMVSERSAILRTAKVSNAQAAKMLNVGLRSVEEASTVRKKAPTRESVTLLRMPWSEPFWKPIKLKDGRLLTTLGDARELIATLPVLKRAESHWRDAEETLSRASVAPSAKDEALAAVVRALKEDGLL